MSASSTKLAAVLSLAWVAACFLPNLPYNCDVDSDCPGATYSVCDRAQHICADPATLTPGCDDGDCALRECPDGTSFQCSEARTQCGDSASGCCDKSNFCDVRPDIGGGCHDEPVDCTSITRCLGEYEICPYSPTERLTPHCGTQTFACCSMERPVFCDVKGLTTCVSTVDQCNRTVMCPGGDVHVCESGFWNCDVGACR